MKKRTRRINLGSSFTHTQMRSRSCVGFAPSESQARCIREMAHAGRTCPRCFAQEADNALFKRMIKMSNRIDSSHCSGRNRRSNGRIKKRALDYQTDHSAMNDMSFDRNLIVVNTMKSNRVKYRLQIPCGVCRFA